MNWLNNMRIGQRLNFILSLVVLVIFTSIGSYIIIAQKNKVIADTDLRMNEQVIDLERIISLQTNESKEDIKNIMKIAARLETVYANQNNNSSQENALDYITNNHAFVDEVEALSGGALVSVFGKTSNGFKRLSTNVISNGKRSVGSVISNDSEVSSTLKNGQSFTGRALVIDTWCITSYIPILKDNKVIGAIGVALKEKDMAGLRTIFNEKKYFESGYPFLIDSEGTFIIHPAKEGESAANAEFFQKILKTNKRQGKVNYKWEGREKYLYFTFSESIDSYVATSLYTKELMDIVRQTQNAIIIAFVVGIGLIILIINLLVRSITQSLKQGVQFAESIANGDLSKSIDINQKDEIGQLADALNSMVKNINEIVSGIIDGSSNVSIASQEMSSRSENISQGANEQAASVEEMSSTMEEIASNIEQNTHNAKETEVVAQSLQEKIEVVNSKSSKSLEATRKISEKINIINDIAFQTNILALNAAVEAARAGEHGKGFAVVAAEVRKLAENSKKAANEIIELSSSTLEYAEETGNGLQEMLPEVKKTSHLVQEITAASIEQNNGAAQINNAIQQLNTITQTNASSSEEMASGAEELAAQAEQLQDLTAFFSTKQ